MMSFLKTFGKGILYFIGLPFLIVFLVLYGIYLFGIFLYYFLKMIIYFFKGKKFNLKDEMDDKALYILKQRKAEAINKELNPTPTNITNNFTNINVIISNFPILNIIKPIDKICNGCFTCTCTSYKCNFLSFLRKQVNIMKD